MYRKEDITKTNKRIVTYLKEEDYNYLLILADESGRKIADYVRFLLEHHITLARQQEAE